MEIEILRKRATEMEKVSDLAEFSMQLINEIDATRGQLGQVRANLDEIAADFKVAKDTLKEVGHKAQVAEELAKSHAATLPTGPIKRSTALGLKRMALSVKAERFKDEAGRAIFPASIDALQFGLGTMPDAMLSYYDEDVRNLVHRWRRVHDDLAITHAAFMGLGAQQVQQYLERGGQKALPMWGQFQELSRQVQLVAMDTAESSAGSDWVVTATAFGLLEDVRPGFDLVPRLTQVQMPRSPYTIPVQGADFQPYLIAEATTDPTATLVAAKNIVTAQVSATAKKLMALTYYSLELEEDSITPLVAAIRADHSSAQARGQEHFWINGQVTAISGAASTFDTGATFGTGTSMDNRTMMDGLRYQAITNGITVAAGGALTFDHCTQLKGALKRFGKSGREGVWATSYRGYAALLALKDNGNNAITAPMYAAGGNATAFTGELPTLLGSPIAVCDDYPQDMAASGIDAGAGGGTTSITYANTRRCLHCAVRAVTIDTSREVGFAFAADVAAVKSTWRGIGKYAITPNATTETSVGSIIGV